MAHTPLPPPARLGRQNKWTYHSKLTNDARELFLYTVTAAPAPRPGGSPGQYVVVKRVDDKEAQVHARLCAAGGGAGAAIPGSRFNNNNNTTGKAYPHIIQILDCIPLRAVPGLRAPTTTTDAYLVLEHATGGTLEALLARLRSRQPTATARFPFNKPTLQQQQQLLPGWFCYHVLAAVTDAVLRMHTRDGLLHTDLHLKNVVFQKQQQMASLPHSSSSSASSSLFPNPDEIPLEEPAAAANSTNATDRWAAPVVKIIDFGRVHQLPEPEDGDDDDGRGQWEAQPSPCVRLLAQLMLQQARDLYDDDGSFAASFLEPLARSQVSVAVLREVRRVAMARKEENVYVPRWLREYFH